jgi:chromosome partitioning protein
MLVQASQGQSGSAHVVVLGNEKGGSGKSTTALHIAVALMKAGQRVATIDLDCRQQSFTRYINNRQAWARRTGLELELPVHRCIKAGLTMQVADNENSELQQFMDAVGAVEHSFDFIVIDTPGTDSYLMRLAHSMADTLVTPLNDSFVDFDLIGQVDAETFKVRRLSFYAELIWEARKKRAMATIRDQKREMDWVVVRNRTGFTEARNMRRIDQALTELSKRVGFRVTSGLSERVIYRELFPSGLTLLDKGHLGELGTSHLVARQELRQLIAGLNLPLPGRPQAELALAQSA